MAPLQRTRASYHQRRLAGCAAALLLLAAVALEATCARAAASNVTIPHACWNSTVAVAPAFPAANPGFMAVCTCLCLPGLAASPAVAGTPDTTPSQLPRYGSAAPLLCSYRTAGRVHQWHRLWARGGKLHGDGGRRRHQPDDRGAQPQRRGRQRHGVVRSAGGARHLVLHFGAGVQHRRPSRSLQDNHGGGVRTRV